MNFNYLTQKELYNLILNRRIEAKPSNKKMTLFFDDDDHYHEELFRVLEEKKLYKNLIGRALNELLRSDTGNECLILNMYYSVLADSDFMRSFFNINVNRHENIKISFLGSSNILSRNLNQLSQKNFEKLIKLNLISD